MKKLHNYDVHNPYLLEKILILVDFFVLIWSPWRDIEEQKIEIKKKIVSGH